MYVDNTYMHRGKSDVVVSEESEISTNVIFYCLVSIIEVRGHDVIQLSMTTTQLSIGT